jgi:1,4-dihydroxy-6-naphthoate synthase
MAPSTRIPRIGMAHADCFRQTEWLKPAVELRLPLQNPFLFLSTAAKMTILQTEIRVGHSPDPDDAFMFYALANDKLDTGAYAFHHELVDIETLNQRAFRQELELTAISIHAYASLHQAYILCPCGASMGDNYGPMVVTRPEFAGRDIASLTIAVPGKLTSAFLALRLFLGRDFSFEIVPFDRIPDAVVAGAWEGKRIDAGLLIHEGQLTYANQGLRLAVELGEWWYAETGLPLPLGANAIRRDLGPQVARDVTRLLLQSIEYALEHRSDALQYANRFGRDLDTAQADRFVGMYVNEWTRDFGERGREAVELFLRRGYEIGFLPTRILPEYVSLG